MRSESEEPVSEEDMKENHVNNVNNVVMNNHIGNSVIANHTHEKSG